MRNIVKIILFAALALSLASCGAYKRLGYLQDMEDGIDYSMPMQPEAIISKGDRLNIYVTCPQQELAEPFNVMNGIYTGGAAKGVTVSEEASAPMDVWGFEVNEDGNINYPVLGAVKVGNLTLKQVEDSIEEQLVERGLIKEPMVRASFSNFKIIVLGEGGKGVYDVPDGKVDIFEALAMSEDLTEDAERDEVWVIRTRDNARRLYKINLKSKDCFYSPAFYLQQNDMVYAKPMDRKFDTTTSNRWQVFNTTLSSINILLWITDRFRR